MLELRTSSMPEANLSTNDVLGDLGSLSPFGNLTFDDLLHVNQTDPVLYDALRDGRYAGVAVIFYTLVVSVGVAGNFFVVLTLASSDQTSTATDVFIASLAVVDVLVCIVDLPVSLYYQLTDHWVFGAAMCHVVPTLQAVVAYGSTLTMVIIAIDRFILIVYPLRPRMTLAVACCLLAGAYTMATVVASPIGIFARYYEVDMRHGPLRIERTYCLEQWPSPNYRHYYGLLTFAIHFVVPLMATSVLYVMIFRRLQGRLGQGATAKSRGHRTTIMLVAVVAMFTIAWTPFHIFTLISEFSYDSIKGRYFKFTDVMLRGFAMSSSCVNPFLYGWFNEGYRTAFLDIVSRMFGIKDFRQKCDGYRQQYEQGREPSRCDVILGRIKAVVGISPSQSNLHKTAPFSDKEDISDVDDLNVKSHQATNQKEGHANETTPLALFVKTPVERKRSGSNITISTLDMLSPDTEEKNIVCNMP